MEGPFSQYIKVYNKMNYKTVNFKLPKEITLDMPELDKALKEYVNFKLDNEN
jgi:hypothetical protein